MSQAVSYPRPWANIPPSDEIYSILAQHQQHSDWEESEVASKLLQDTFAELHRWADRFVFEFKLEIPAVSLGVQKLRRRTLGHFRSCNGFGLKHEIMLDACHVFQGDPHEVLGTLLHELLHAWQYIHSKPGKRNYHNREYQRKAEDHGLLVNRRGEQQLYPAPTPFSELLESHGVSFPALPAITRELEVSVKPGRTNSSKLKLWECGCGQKARVGKATFSARCTICNTDFQQVCF
ncbi:MAG: hypothetical protein R3E01_36345 [Pirellulaceae bacterium]|nr:hypothetical protein [Planctomycetales bacterium]